MSIITFLSDFGLQDEYVSSVKGVVLSINPQALMVDITHEIPAQNVAWAGQILNSSYAWFPSGTIHVAVVDPGVGSGRAIIASQHAKCIFLAPDNGLLTTVWHQDPPQTIIRVENETLFMKPTSHTFHGRDIFAPVAAHLSLGMDLKHLGNEMGLEDAVQLNLAQAVFTSSNEIVGQVLGKDRFGNLITNISSCMIDQLSSKIKGSKLLVHIADTTIQGVASSYASCTNDQLIAIVGSRSSLEIAINGGRAADRFDTLTELQVRVCI